MSLLKLIITAAEEVCDELENRVKDHPLVKETFQDTGNWYSNGETGPEWFTISIYTNETSKEEIEELVRKELKDMGRMASNMFWDHA